MKNRSLIIKYAVTFAIGLLLSLGIFLLKDLFSQTEPIMIFSILSDGFFITGALLIGAGLIVLCTNQGLFDGLTYAFYTLFVTHNWSRTKLEDKKSYVEYREDKAEKRGGTPLYLIIVGAVFLTAAIVMLMLYRNQ